MRVIGVTGGIGSGKTTVCNILSSLGCRIFNADQVAKELQETDPEVIAGIKALFGEEIYTGNVPNRKNCAAGVQRQGKVDGTESPDSSESIRTLS